MMNRVKRRTEEQHAQRAVNARKMSKDGRVDVGQRRGAHGACVEGRTRGGSTEEVLVQR